MAESRKPKMFVTGVKSGVGPAVPERLKQKHAITIAAENVFIALHRRTRTEEPKLNSYARTCPLPITSYLVDVNSVRAKGPRQ